ncbi:MAG TPA: 1-acyl-sn-glycerol-3-phosphate acyltransferase [Acidimicrobiales bacterium]|nr:1-acyl-sn-glycerol-3-phosphate acyltransferase [Acidimicrobiales bacterium]
MTVPAVLLVTVVATALSPVLCAAAAGYDVVRLRSRLPALRTLLFVLQYLIVDATLVVAASAYWVRAGFGTRLRSEASLERHHRVQRWSVTLLERRAGQLLGARLELEPGTAEAFGVGADRAAGPVIVCSRHVNLLDAGVPVLLLNRLGLQMRAVIMAEMLMDPGFDLIYRRLGSVFIARDRGLEALRAVARLADGITPQTGAVIFPEGRLFRPALVPLILKRIAARDPERAQRLSNLRNVLPPRPAGMGVLLDALPGADVVFIASTGLDDVPRFSDFARRAPLREPIRVTAWRCGRATIPADQDGRTEWLDGQWQRVDDVVSALARH